MVQRRPGDGAGYATIRRPAVAGTFYPADPRELTDMIDRQLEYARHLLSRMKACAERLDAECGDGRADASSGRHPGRPWPKAVIVPHAGYVYSGTTAALAYALLERGRGVVRRAVVMGPTHRVAVRGVAMDTADAWRTPLGVVPVDVTEGRRAMRALESASASGGTPPLFYDARTHAREHAVEVQVPFLQRVLGDDISIVPLNASSVSAETCGDVLQELWGGEETVIVISSDLSHYHPHAEARAIDDATIAKIDDLDLPIDPYYACGAFPINGILSVLDRRPGLRLVPLGRATSGDDGVVALAGDARPMMGDADEPVVGYASWAIWEEEASPADAGRTLMLLARTALAEHLGVPAPTDDSVDGIIAGNPWLRRRGACFVTLTEHGRLRGCIGTLEAYRPLGRDVVAHAVDAATHDPRFAPVDAGEYPMLDVEVSVLDEPSPMDVRSRDELERALRPGVDGLVVSDGSGRHRATYLPQVWEQLSDPHDFVSHLLGKAGLSPRLDWRNGEIRCERYGVTVYTDADLPPVARKDGDDGR